MFSHKNTKESETGVVEIAEANADAVRALVRFCYGGCVEKLDEMVVDLFVLSDRYEMESLMVRESKLALAKNYAFRSFARIESAS